MDERFRADRDSVSIESSTSEPAPEKGTARRKPGLAKSRVYRKSDLPTTAGLPGTRTTVNIAARLHPAPKGGAGPDVRMELVPKGCTLR